MQIFNRNCKALLTKLAGQQKAFCAHGAALVFSSAWHALALRLGHAQNENPWPRVREYDGATPKKENRWMGALDYPGDALRKGERNNVVVAFDITVDGRAKNRVVSSSSGSRSLDGVSCRLIERNARFEPARDESGPIATKGRYSFAFSLPD